MIPFIKRKWLKETLIGYMACVGVLGAISYIVKPSSAMITPYIVLGIQTFIWHDLLIGAGFFAATYHEIGGKKGLPYLLKGFAMFVILLFIAIALNEVGNAIAPSAEFNFFYVSSSQQSLIFPLLNLIFKKPEPFVPFIISFIIYFSIGILIVYAIETIIYSVSGHKRNRTEN